jgi:hypothetical protein
MQALTQATVVCPMAKAVRSLSPKQILERMQRHRRAVMVLAHQSAQRAVKARLRARGVRLWDVTAKDISIRARAWFDAHREELIAEAEQVIATSPLFAYLRTNAQKENEPKSITSAVQMLGAK